MSLFEPLDQALLWLRLRRRRKQREVAATAGITQAMLSSYEKGHRIPSLNSLQRILCALDAGLPELHEALEVVRSTPAPREAAGTRTPASPPPARRQSLQDLLDELQRSMLRVSEEISVRDEEDG